MIAHRPGCNARGCAPTCDSNAVDLPGRPEFPMRDGQLAWSNDGGHTWHAKDRIDPGEAALVDRLDRLITEQAEAELLRDRLQGEHLAAVKLSLDLSRLVGQVKDGLHAYRETAGS